MPEQPPIGTSPETVSAELTKEAQRWWRSAKISELMFGAAC